MSIQPNFRRFRLVGAASLGLFFVAFASGQSTGAIQGTVTDSIRRSGSGAMVTVRGSELTGLTDAGDRFGRHLFMCLAAGGNLQR